jgi:hypothetical protein
MDPVQRIQRRTVRQNRTKSRLLALYSQGDPMPAALAHVTPAVFFRAELLIPQAIDERKRLVAI